MSTLDVSISIDPISPGATRRSQSIWKRARRIVISLLVMYLAVCTVMVFSETRLLYPAPSIRYGNWERTDLAHEEVWFTSADGTRLYGWFLPHPDPQMAILYCHGNGENVATAANFLAEVRDELDASVFVFDYRGYGRSEGKPFEAGIVEDGLAAQNWLAERISIEPKDIVVWGRSLGGGVAVAIAAEQNARALVLENTYSSAVDVAARRYPWLPVRWLMRNQYDSVARIVKFQGPVFQSHGALDRIVPIQLGRQLFEFAPSTQKHFLELPDAGHNHFPPANYYPALRAFLAEAFSGSN